MCPKRIFLPLSDEKRPLWHVSCAPNEMLRHVAEARMGLGAIGIFIIYRSGVTCIPVLEKPTLMAPCLSVR